MILELSKFDRINDQKMTENSKLNKLEAVIGQHRCHHNFSMPTRLSRLDAFLVKFQLGTLIDNV